MLWERCEAGIGERFGHLGDRERERAFRRMRDELCTIQGFGFATFFLTVADVTDLIREMGIRNQARGSGAGSLVNYLLRISNVNPLEHDLLFERFLGRARSTLPDIDVDVESARRHDVYRAIFEKYGSNRVTLLSMQSTYRARGAVRDAGLALGLDDAQIALSVVNGANALEAGIKPAEDAIVLEKMDGNPFINGLVTTQENADDVRVQAVAKALKDPRLTAWIKQTYAGSVVPVA